MTYDTAVRFIRTTTVFVFIFTLIFSLLSEICIPADLFINPVRLFVSARQKATIIRIKNNSDQKVSLQINAYSWIQNENAEDKYSPTKDIILFPKILSLNGGVERIVRVGIRATPQTKEKTYRIYLEELPQPFKPEKETVLRTILRIGVPVFLPPAKPQVVGEIEDMAFSKGNLSLRVKNKGNVHFIIQSVKVKGVDAAGTSIFQTEVANRYLLEGHIRLFSFTIPKGDCSKMGALTVDVITDKFSLSKRLDVSPKMCSP